MARDRQRQKQRQAARRAERIEQRRSSGGDGKTAPRTTAPEEGLPDEAFSDAELEELADLEVGAPPQDVGRSDTVVEHPPDPFDTDADDVELGGGGGGAATAGPVGRRGGAATATHHQHGRVVGFLIAVWAELGRVQWPNRQQLIQLTGVVLFFVLIVGAYLGGLDALFSKLINAIL